MSNRLTHKIAGEYVAAGIDDWVYITYPLQYTGITIDRLAAYEDTGLEPREIINLKHQLHLSEELSYSLFNLCISAGEERMQYRALGTVEELAELKQGCEDCEIAKRDFAFMHEFDVEHIRALLAAEKCNRLVLLPPIEVSDCEGLKVKYRVYKADDNTPVENCFVLRPDKDTAAVAALTAYAKTTENKQLAADILNWITPDEKVNVLPCKVGDVVYTIESFEKELYIGETQVMHIDIGADIALLDGDDNLICHQEDFGTYAHFTHEQAEQALKEEQNG